MGELVARILTGVISGVVTKLLLSFLERSAKLLDPMLRVIRRRQEKTQRVVLRAIYLDLEEILGDYSERMRELAKYTRPVSRREYVVTMLKASVGLLVGLSTVILQSLWFVEEEEENIK